MVLAGSAGSQEVLSTGPRAGAGSRVVERWEGRVSEQAPGGEEGVEHD